MYVAASKRLSATPFIRVLSVWPYKVKTACMLKGYQAPIIIKWCTAIDKCCGQYDYMIVLIDL